MANLTSETRSSEANPPDRRWNALVTVAIGVAAVGGIILRFATSSPMWIDEALSVNVALLTPSAMVEALRHDGHPILYYLLLGWWTDLFGASDLAARSLSGVFSIASVPVIWAVARRRHGTEVARHAVAIALAAPFLMRYGTEARMYSMLVFLVALGWLLIDRALSDPSLKRLWPVVLVAAVLVHTHYWTFWLLAAVGSMLLWRWRLGRDDDERVASLRALIAMSVGAASFVIWIPVFLDQARHTGTPWAADARPAEVVVEAVQAIGGGRRFEPMLLGIVLVMMATLGALFIGRDRQEIRLSMTAHPSTVGPAVVILGTLAIGILVSVAVGGAFEARYTAVVVPLVIVLIARGSTALGHRAAPITLLLLVFGGLFVAADDARRDRSQGQEVAAAIDSIAGPGDLVAFCPDQIAPPTLRYLDFDGPALPYPGGFDPGRIDWYDYVSRIAKADPVEFAIDLDAAAGANSVFLVFNSTYSGFEGRCETIVDTLVELGRTDQILVNGRPIFQPMFLRRLVALP